MDPPGDTPRAAPDPPGSHGHVDPWGRLSRAAGQASWVAGLTLALSAFMGWYSGSAPEGPVLSVLGWNTGTVGKLVFVVGLAIVLLAVGRVVDVRLPGGLHEGIVLVVLGTAAAVLVLIRVVSIPDQLAGTADRAVGLWVGLASATVVILAGLVRAGEEL